MTLQGFLDESDEQAQENSLLAGKPDRWRRTESEMNFLPDRKRDGWRPALPAVVRASDRTPVVRSALDRGAALGERGYNPAGQKTPPVIGAGTPVVPGKEIGRPLRERRAR